MQSLPPQLVSFGEVLIDLVQRPDGFSWHFGGAPANAAIASAQLGVRASIVASVGSDYFGEFILQQLRVHKVESIAVSMHKQRQTSLAFIFLDKYGSQTGFLFYRDADLYISANQVDTIFSPVGQVFCFGSLSLTHAHLKTSLNTILRKYYGTSSIVLFDLNLRTSLWCNLDKWRCRVNEFLPKASIIKANENEAYLLTGYSDPQRATEAIWCDNNQLIVITLQEHGCFYKTITNSGYIPSFHVDTQCGDAVGTGDAFVGALCAGVINATKRGDDFHDDRVIKQILLRSNAAGAIVATVQGAIAPSLTAENIESMLVLNKTIR